MAPLWPLTFSSGERLLFLYVMPCLVVLAGPLLQRVAIIQKDERGYGLTVSGDNPVYVNQVKPGMHTHACLL